MKTPELHRVQGHVSDWDSTVTVPALQQPCCIPADVRAKNLVWVHRIMCYYRQHLMCFVTLWCTNVLEMLYV